MSQSEQPESQQSECTLPALPEKKRIHYTPQTDSTMCTKWRTLFTSRG